MTLDDLQKIATEGGRWGWVAVIALALIGAAPKLWGLRLRYRRAERKDALDEWQGICDEFKEQIREQNLAIADISGKLDACEVAREALERLHATKIAELNSQVILLEMRLNAHPAR